MLDRCRNAGSQDQYRLDVGPDYPSDHDLHVEAGSTSVLVHNCTFTSWDKGQTRGRHLRGPDQPRHRAGNRTAVIHTTSNHPSWDQTTRRWVEAGALRYGNRRPRLDPPRSPPAGCGDLTIPGDHDFYINRHDYTRPQLR